jgi:large subunit ribosomal protein L7/L12
MTATVEQIMTLLKTLTLIEAKDLVSEIQTVFEVDISAPVQTAGPTVAAPEEAVEEKTTFDVMVQEVANEKRVAVLKVIRKLTSLSLSDAKAFTTNLPQALKEGVSQVEADEAKMALEEAGAKVTIA